MKEYALIFAQAIDSDYGALAPIVKNAGCLIAATLALTFSWKRRAKWEPIEEDLPKGPQKVVGLLSAIVIGVLWFFAGSDYQSFLVRLALCLAGFCVIFFLLYGYLIKLQVYSKIIVVEGKSVYCKTIGGYRLTDHAKKEIRKKKISIQEFFEGVAYKSDHVWTRPSRALAIATFNLAYIGLVACGTVALGATSILLSLLNSNKALN